MTTMTTMESLIPSKTELGLIENLVVTPFELNGWPSLRGVSSPGAPFLCNTELLHDGILHAFQTSNYLPNREASPSYYQGGRTIPVI